MNIEHKFCRILTKKISNLSGQLEAINQLSEPQENYCLSFSQNTNFDPQSEVLLLFNDIGKLKSSTTKPSASTLLIKNAITHLR